MIRNFVILSKNNKKKRCINKFKNKFKNLSTSGNNNGKDNDNDYFLMLIATYLSYYYQK
jgi:hypothetical protein